MTATDERVTLPVSDAASLRDNGRAAVDAETVANRNGTACAVAFALAVMTQVIDEFLANLRVGRQPALDGLV